MWFLGGKPKPHCSQITLKRVNFAQENLFWDSCHLPNPRIYDEVLKRDEKYTTVFPAWSIKAASTTVAESFNAWPHQIFSVMIIGVTLYCDGDVISDDHFLETFATWQPYFCLKQVQE